MTRLLGIISAWAQFFLAPSEPSTPASSSTWPRRPPCTASVSGSPSTGSERTSPAEATQYLFPSLVEWLTHRPEVRCQQLLKDLVSRIEQAETVRVWVERMAADSGSSRPLVAAACRTVRGNDTALRQPPVDTS